MTLSKSTMLVVFVCAAAFYSNYVTATTENTCSSDEFKCDVSGECIPSSWECDLLDDCPDRQDEIRCCSTSEFNCLNGRCIDLSEVCDGNKDCDDGEDEQKCKVEDCRADEYTCLTSGHCIPAVWECDSIDDCPHREDELRCCPDDKFTCNNGDCIEYSMVCNGEKDCDDGIDELEQYCADFDFCATDANNCNENATCVSVPGSFMCECKEGFQGDGLTCSDIDECIENTHNCSIHAACTNSEGGFTCQCNMGFDGDGMVCLDVDECTTEENYCHEIEHATCINMPGSFECTCTEGYHGDGYCTDIDECVEDTHTCPYHSTCNNTEGSYTCHCDDGFIGDGLSCEDVDECNITIGLCHKDATCMNIDGGYYCECDAGYRGDGSSSCNDINECTEDTHGCAILATCANTVGSYNCTCHAGLEGNGFSCRDIDECHVHTHNCHEHATCINRFGLFDCKCKEGFHGDGIKCYDIDECEVANDCSAFATCTNSIGSYTCRCHTGYKGDGKTCKPFTPQQGALRLVGGNNIYEGRVEIYADTTWNTICDNAWDDANAVVVCRQLGYPYGYPMALRGSHFGPGSGPTVMNNVACEGNEDELRDCRHRTYDINCDRNDQAGVICTDHSNIRLADSKEASYSVKGRVQIMKNGIWGNVCDKNWDDLDAKVICRQLGLPYDDARSYSDPVSPLQTSELFTIDYVECIGDEHELHKCFHTSGVRGYCEFASVICSDGLEINAKPDLFDTDICGTRANIGGRIAGGQDASPSSWPWAAALLGDMMDGRTRLCAASLINNDWAITAAQCIPDEYKTIRLIFGDTNIRNDGQSESRVLRTATPICHPDYDKSLGYKFDNDICLLKLNESVTYNEHIRPVCLGVSQEEDATYGSCYAIGWGDIRENGPYSNELQELATNLVSKTECKKIYFDSISANMICSDTGSESSVCPGDGGGPLVCQSGPNSWHAVGIASFGRKGCGQDDIPTVFTRVSRYTSWIYKVVTEYGMDPSN